MNKKCIILQYTSFLGIYLYHTMSENTFLYWFHKWEREYIVGMEAPFCCYRKRAYVLKGALSFFLSTWVSFPSDVILWRRSEIEFHNEWRKCSTKVIVIYAMYYVLRFLGVVWKYTWIKDFFYWVEKVNFFTWPY